MNVTIENLAPCKKLMRVEIEVQKVDEALDSTTRKFQKEASLPGFRPGKAPREMVLRKYLKDIEAESKRTLISEAYKKALDEKDIEVVGYPDIEEIQFGRGQPLQFAATIETAPEFELPEYKGIPVQREARTVTDEDVVRALDVLRESRPTFETVDRPLQTGDIAVINYTGVCDGKPIAEIAPASKGLAEQKAFWVEVGANSFLPGFGDQLAGAKAGEKRTVNIDFPANFMTPELAGKRGVYDVEVTEVKQKVLPPLDETLAKNYGADSVETLRAGVRRDLENELKYKQERTVRDQLIRSLLNRVQFELPESSVAYETRNVVYDLVQQNAKRGVSRETFEQQKDQIYSAAAQSAKERVKLQFLLRKIAEKEDVKVSEQEIAQRINHLAALQKIPFEKYLKDLQSRNALIEIYDQIMNEKVIELLQSNAKFEDVPPAA